MAEYVTRKEFEELRAELVKTQKILQKQINQDKRDMNDYAGSLHSSTSDRLVGINTALMELSDEVYGTEE